MQLFGFETVRRIFKLILKVYIDKTENNAFFSNSEYLLIC